MKSLGEAAIQRILSKAEDLLTLADQIVLLLVKLTLFTGVGLGENIPAGLSLGQRHSRTGT